MDSAQLAAENCQFADDVETGIELPKRERVVLLRYPRATVVKKVSGPRVRRPVAPDLANSPSRKILTLTPDPKASEELARRNPPPQEWFDADEDKPW